MKKLLRTTLLALLIVSLLGASTAYALTPADLGTKYPNLNENLWSLVWSDEFSGSSVDTSKWSFTVGGGGFGNNEQQYYTNSTNNAYIDNGVLVIRAIQESNGTENYTSAKLSSTESWTYGKFEFRAKLPEGTGLWPAIWMLPEDINVYGGEWPICGEIDIMEYMGSDPGTALGTLHYGNPWVYNTGYYYLSSGESFADDYHTFTMEWLPGEIRWYVDGNIYQIQQNWYSTSTTQSYSYPAPFDQDFYLMLNLAVGGYFPGNPNPSDWTSDKFYIDYVRVYEYTGTYDEVSGNIQTPYVNLLTNSYFDTTADGWTTWTENGSVFSVEDSTLKADIYTTLPNTWSTQLYQNVDVYNTTTYELSFRVRSTVSRPITVALEGLNNATLYSNTVNATSTWQEFTYEFTPTASCDNAKLLFFLGNVTGASNTSHTVYFDNITLTPLPDDCVSNGDFSNGLTDWTTWTENGSTFTTNASEGCFETAVYTTLPNAWSTQLYQNIDLNSSGTYKITFRVKSSSARQLRVALEKSGMTSPLDVTFDASSSWTSLSYTFNVSSSLSGAKLVFMLGNVGTSTNQSYTIDIDDVMVYRIA